MSQITYRCRTKVTTRLADLTYGYNTTLAGIAAGRGIVPWTIDFGAPGKTFFQTQTDPAIVEGSATIGGNWLAVYSVRADDDAHQKAQLFSGQVQLGIDHHIYYKSSRLPSDTETPADTVLDTMTAVMNSPYTQSWGYEIVYNGTISEVRYPLSNTTNKDSWRQTQRFLLRFTVNER